MEEKIIVINCPNCKKRNEIPVRVFYDGYEGPMVCTWCHQDLEVDVEEGE